jgi:hypothetical protein
MDVRTQPIFQHCTRYNPGRLSVRDSAHDVMGKYGIRAELVELSMVGVGFDPCTPTLQMEHPNLALIRSRPVILNWLHNVVRRVSP